MLVKLKQHIMEGGNVKCAVKKNKNWTAPKVVDGKVVECDLSQTTVTPFVQGAVIDVAQSTAQKWIDKGWAEAVNPPLEKKEVKETPKQEPKQEQPKQEEVDALAPVKRKPK